MAEYTFCKNYGWGGGGGGGLEGNTFEEFSSIKIFFSSYFFGAGDGVGDDIQNIKYFLLFSFQV